MLPVIGFKINPDIPFNVPVKKPQTPFFLDSSNGQVNRPCKTKSNSL